MKLSTGSSWFLGASLGLLVLGALLFGAALQRHRAEVPEARPQFISCAGTSMGCAWSVMVPWLPPTESREHLESSIAALLDRLDGQMSNWRNDSALSRFNRYRETDWFAVPAELARIVTTARQVSDETGGAFDITVAPLVNLWGFGREATGLRIGRVPSEEAIQSARSHVGYRLVEARLSPPALRKLDPEVQIDLGAIGKGYAAQAVAEFLDSLGTRDYLVAVGGELHARGDATPGRPWQVGIDTPTADVQRVFARLALRDASLSTSGDYRNFYDVNGTRFCHEIDPRTGRPVANPTASVSVIDSSGATADAMATALLVLGPDRGLDLARRLRLPAMFIARGNGRFETRKTPDFPASVLTPEPPASAASR